MASDHRADFERRLLALVRKELDDLDGANEPGYAIGRFVVLYEVLYPSREGEDLPPWANSWADFSGLDYAFSDSSWWVQLGMMREILDQLEDQRSDERLDRRYPRDDNDDDEPSS